jgi:hypothetical protein
VLANDRTEGVTDQEAYAKADSNLSYNIAHSLDCIAQFFHVRLIRGEHGILWTAIKCLHSRSFTQMLGK